MKLSKRTLAVLKNFASINQSLVVKKGNMITTISDTRDVLARAAIDETFEASFAIYDLNEFLGALSLFNDPDILFNEEHLLITEGKRSQRFWYADPTVITQPPERELKLPSQDVSVRLEKDDVSAMNRAASVNNASDVLFVGNTIEGQYVSLRDKTNPTSNSFQLSLADDTPADYEMALTIDKINKLIPLDYDVNISARGMAHFFNPEQKVEYFLALAPGAKYAAK